MRFAGKPIDVLFLGILGIGCTPKSLSKARTEKLSPSSQVVEVARSYIGVPYKLGGMDRRGMDCSGLVCRVYHEAANLSLPRTADAQAQQGQPIKGKLQPGDLVFFQEPRAKKITHVGIVSRVEKEAVYFIHASTSKGVREDRLNDPYWQKRYAGARRLLPSPAKAALRTDQQGK